MGRAASPALPVVLPLFAQRGSRLMNDWRERQRWQVALVRMGLPIEQLPFSDNFTPEQIARDRRETLEAAARYDPDYRYGSDY
jgi:hypothetical protein